MSSIRLTDKNVAVLRVFLADVTQQHYGYDLMRTLKFSSGTLYPILARFEDAGWLQGEFETVAQGPPRRWYRLTAAGIEAAQDITG